MNTTFWKNKRVLITGHTGFKGSWMSLWLQRAGADVTGFALSPPTHPSLFEDSGAASGMTSLDGDVRDLERLSAAFAVHRPEIVFHMAAQSLVRPSYTAPVETYATNVMGTVNLLEAVRKSSGVRAVVIVTSDKCYQNREWVWGYRETEPMGGYDPYSNSKGCAELVTAAYRDSYFGAAEYARHGVAVASARAGNVIGGGDWAADRLVPDIMRALLAGRPVVIRHPNAVRPWQHVLEPVNGYLHLAERLWEQGPLFAEGWNFGPDENDVRPVSWIVERLARGWGAGARWELDTTPLAHEAHYLKLDCSKAKTLLGWSPRLPLATTLEWLVAWYKGYSRKEPARTLVEAEITRFEAMNPC